MMKVYEKRPGFYLKNSAQVIGEELDRINNKYGEIRPQTVVDESRDDDAVLHPEFEWCDPVAAETYRREQARKLLRAIFVVEEDRPKTRAFECVKVVREEAEEPRREERVFRTREEIMADPDARAELMARAIRDAVAFRHRFAELSELAKIFEAIDQVAEAAVS